MISGATRGTGGSALGAHLADAKQLNENTELGLSRGLVGTTIRQQIAEITDLASHSRAARPLYHIHADPPPGNDWNESAWQRYWSLTEREFDLERAAFSEERHTKAGREHRHRIYSLVRADGTTNAMPHDFQRREKISRIIEHETGAALTPGAHNRAVVSALIKEGRKDVAAAMSKAGLDTMERPRAPTSPKDRAQAERTGVNPRTVGAGALAAWTASDNAESFQTALREKGLRLAEGTKAAVLIDASGNVHALAKVLGTESKGAGLDRIAAADVRRRLDGLLLPTVDQLRGEPAQQMLVPVEPAAQVPVVPNSAENANPGVSQPRPAGEPAWASRSSPLISGVDDVATPVSGNLAMSPGTGPTYPKDSLDVESLSPPHRRGPGVLGTGQSAGAGSRGTADPEETGTPAGAAGRSAVGGQLHQDPRGTANRPAACDGRDPGGPDRSAPGSAGRRLGSAELSAIRDRACTHQALRGGRKADPAHLNSLLSRARVLAAPGGSGITDRTGDPWRSFQHMKISLVHTLDEGRAERRARRQRWVAANMARAYDMAWVPERLVANLDRVDVDADHGAIILVLLSGTRIVDRQDRIDVIGKADDVAVEEVAEAVRRRGWRAVSLEGDMDFRVAAAKALYAMSPPVNVLHSPLSQFELAEIDDARPLPLTSSPPALTHQGSARHAGPGEFQTPGMRG